MSGNLLVGWADGANMYCRVEDGVGDLHTNGDPTSSSLWSCAFE
jgi:hypothetical protein